MGIKCSTCAHYDLSEYDFPCSRCLKHGYHEYWEAKKEKTLVGDITTGYMYVDTGIALQASLEAHKAAHTKDIINRKYGVLVDKESIMPPKMNYSDMYVNGNLFGGSSKNPTIKDIDILSGVTTLVWSDGDVTMVTLGPDDTFDMEKAIAMAIAKKFIGTNKSKSNYIEEIRRLGGIAIDKATKRMEKEAKKKAKKKASEFEGCMNPPIEPEVISITVKEFAERAGVTSETIRRQCVKGQFPGAKKIAGKWYIPVVKEG